MGTPSLPSQGLGAYIKQHKHEILVAIIGFILATVVVGTVLVLAQERLKQWLVPEEKEVTLDVKRVSSSVAGFPGQLSMEVIQLLVYEISASDLVEEVKVTAIFQKDTSIIRHNMLYSIDVEGYIITPLQLENYVEFSLKHHLDNKRRINVYIMTKRIINSKEHIKEEYPEIHAKGKNKDGKVVFR